MAGPSYGLGKKPEGHESAAATNQSETVVTSSQYRVQGACASAAQGFRYTPGLPSDESLQAGSFPKHTQLHICGRPYAHPWTSSSRCSLTPPGAASWRNCSPASGRGWSWCTVSACTNPAC